MRPPSTWSRSSPGTPPGAGFLLRCRPYHTLDSVVEGVVIPFTELSEVKRAQAALRESESLRRLAVVVRHSNPAVVAHDLEGRILGWNPCAARVYGWSEAEALALNVSDLIPEGLREATLAEIRQLGSAAALKPHRTQRLAKDGRIVNVLPTARASGHGSTRPSSRSPTAPAAHAAEVLAYTVIAPSVLLGWCDNSPSFASRCGAGGGS